MGAKRLELLRLLIPSTTAIAMLVNPNNPTSSTDQKDVQAGARSIGAQVSIYTASRESDFEQAFANIVEQKISALLIGDDPFLFSHVINWCGCRRVTRFRPSIFPANSPTPAA
jgi:ABC-type uncharacterized transport system substrate-binding protein